MSLPNTCADCGTALPEDAPSGFCPNCLFRMAFAPSPTAAGDDAVEPATPESRRLGDYELLEELGRGGMGVVWKARQVSLNRLVAVKLIKQGLDSSQVLSRFEAERQALALMDHPNIARVFEAGRTPEGWPFFVMELVQGVPITRFCDQEKLSIRERLELFVSVCQAIQHAHQKGIIHRDIKPGNVLVTRQDGKSVPKVIDFGIAKAVGPRLTEETLQTELGAILGTLEYMSPEQARLDALDIDTRSDIYALGILLYELLTGTTPLNRKAIKQAAFDEVLRRIREEEPPRPSTRLGDSRDSLADTAAKRSLEPARLTRLIEGDVDWIVMKALEKDRNRRYETANGLAQDILRHLHDEPVLAGPPTARYRIGKFVRKHRRAVAAAAGFAFLLTAAAIISTGLALWANRERGAAEQARTTSARNELKARDAADEARDVLHFFEENVLAASRPARGSGLGWNVSLIAALDAAQTNLVTAFSNRPLVQASIRDVLGTTYQHLGEGNAAIAQLRESLALRRSLLGAEHPETLQTMHHLAQAFLKAEQSTAALPLLEEVVRRQRARKGPSDPVTITALGHLGFAHHAAGQTQEGLRLIREATDLALAQTNYQTGDLIALQNILALATKSAGQYSNAIVLFEEALKQSVARVGRGHPTTITLLSGLADAYENAGRAAQSIDLYQEALRLAQQHLPPDHPHTLNVMNNLAKALKNDSRSVDAITLYEDALRRSESVLGPRHPATLGLMHNLAGALDSAGRTLQAIARYETTLGLRREILPPNHPETLMTMNRLAATYNEAGRHRDALVLLQETLQLRTEILGPDHPETFNTINNLGRVHLSLHHFDEAIQLLEKSLRFRTTRLGDAHPDTLATLDDLGMAHLEAGHVAQAIARFETVRDLNRKLFGPNHRQTYDALSSLGLAYQRAERYAEAIPLLTEALQGRTRILGPEHHNTLSTLQALAITYVESDQAAKAIPLLEQSLQHYRHIHGENSSQTLYVMVNLATAFQKVGRTNEALPLLIDTVQRARDHLGPTNRHTLRLAGHAGEALRQAGRPADALPWIQLSYNSQLRSPGLSHENTLEALNNLALVHAALGRTNDALQLLEKGLPAARSALGDSHTLTLTLLRNLAALYAETDRLAEAIPMLDQAARLARVRLGAHSTTDLFLSDLANAYLRAQRIPEAESALRDLLAGRRKLLHPESRTLAGTLAGLGELLLEQKRAHDALPYLQEALSIRIKRIPNDWQCSLSQSHLGEALAALQQYGEAEPLLVAGFEELRQRAAQIPEARRAEILSRATRQLPAFYEAWGNPAKAEAWRQKIQSTEK